MKSIVYIETTIPSYYWDERPSLTFEILRTREWWDREKEYYDLITSELVLEEIGHPNNPYRRKCLDLLHNVPIVAYHEEIRLIANAYLSTRIMPSAHAADAMHLAFAGYYKSDILLTWNCRHLANPNKFRIIREVNVGMGVYTPILTTPYDLRIELAEE